MSERSADSTNGAGPIQSTGPPATPLTGGLSRATPSDPAALHAALIAAARQDVEAADSSPGLTAELAANRAPLPARDVLGRDPLAPDPLGRESLLGPAPDSFAGYQILKEIHRGGQGVVYKAIQKSTQRKVAIKVLREGPFAAPAERARFEREVQILAALNHSNIVAIHDSGEAAGQFFYVMDYISGHPLDTHMAATAWSIADTLKLFAKICEAVNAAQLRGIIHRDLKPGNIRVDPQGEPHILDFGLAKVAIGAVEIGNRRSAIGNPVMTETGQFVGSLPWASPEQAEGIPGKIDLRTDVYSLGVILYQMLTGKFPYDVSGAWRDVIERIIKAEPIRPSKMGGGRLARGINDEVETIVLKCLAKDRDRRYQTAGELARDVRRYLAGEPIEAKRDSLGYVIRKRLRRHRGAAAAAGLFLSLLIGATIVSTAFWQRAERGSQAARDAADKAEQISDFLQNMLASLNPEKVEGRDVSLMLETLDEAGKRLEIELPNRPEVRARLHRTLGQTYRNLGESRKAEHHLRHALAIRRALHPGDDAEVAETLHELGRLLMMRDPVDAQESVALVDEALAMRRRLFGEDHPAVAESLVSWADRHDHDLGWPEVEQVFRQALEIQTKWLGDDHPDTAHTRFFIGQTLANREMYDAAEPYFRQSLEYRLKTFGENDWRTASGYSLLAGLLLDKGDAAGAAPYAERAIEIVERVLPLDHLNRSYPLSTVGRVRLAQGDPAGAESYLREALRIRCLHLPAGHWRIAKAETLLGACLTALGRVEEAEPLLVGRYDPIRSTYGDSDRHTLGALRRIVALYEARGERDKAEEYRALLRATSPASAPVAGD